MNALQVRIICAAGLALSNTALFAGNVGTLSNANCSSISGTANSAGVGINVDLYADTELLATVVSSNVSPNPFSLNTPASVMDDQVHLIYAYFGGTNSPLQGSPIRIAVSRWSYGLPI